MKTYRLIFICLLLLLINQSPLYPQDNTSLKIYTGGTLAGLNIFKDSDNTKAEVGFSLGIAFVKNISERIIFSPGIEYNSYNFKFVIPPDRFGNIIEDYLNNLKFDAQIETISLPITFDYILFKNTLNYSVIFGLKPAYIFNKETKPALIINNGRYIQINERSVELFNNYQLHGILGFSVKKRVEKKVEISFTIFLQQEVTSLYKSDIQTYRLYSLLINIGINIRL